MFTTKRWGNWRFECFVPWTPPLALGLRPHRPKRYGSGLGARLGVRVPFQNFVCSHSFSIFVSCLMCQFTTFAHHRSPKQHHVLLVPTIFFLCSLVSPVSELWRGSTKTADSRIRHFRDLLIIRSLSNRDFKTRAANGSELFFLTTWLHTTTLTLLSTFSPSEIISMKIWETPLSWHAKCSLPVAVRVPKTRVLKHPNYEAATTASADKRSLKSKHSCNSDYFAIIPFGRMRR